MGFDRKYYDRFYETKHTRVHGPAEIARLCTAVTAFLEWWSHPVTTVLDYCVFADDGSVDVRIIYDHRVMDGATVARVLARLEDVLTGPILEEIRGGA